LDWQQKVKWFRALNCENQARGSRDTVNWKIFKIFSKIKNTNFGETKMTQMTHMTKMAKTWFDKVGWL
jgi:hypothetical protein